MTHVAVSNNIFPFAMYLRAHVLRRSINNSESDCI